MFFCTSAVVRTSISGTFARVSKNSLLAVAFSTLTCTEVAENNRNISSHVMKRTE